MHQATPDKKLEKMVSWGLGIVVVVAAFIGVSLCDSDTSSDSTPTVSAPAASSDSETSRPYTPGRYTIASDGCFGCVNRATYDEILSFLVQGDKEAFTNALVACTIYGTATLFGEGEVVYLIQTKMWDGMVQIRREGEVEKWWTAMEAID